MKGHPGYGEASKVNRCCSSAAKHSTSYGGNTESPDGDDDRCSLVACGADVTAGREPPIRGRYQLALRANSGLAASAAGSGKYTAHGDSSCYSASVNGHRRDADYFRFTVNRGCDVSGAGAVLGLAC